MTTNADKDLYLLVVTDLAKPVDQRVCDEHLFEVTKEVVFDYLETNPGAEFTVAGIWSTAPTDKGQLLYYAVHVFGNHIRNAEVYDYSFSDFEHELCNGQMVTISKVL